MPLTEDLRILIIDDDEVDRMTVSRALRSGGVAVAEKQEATCLAEGLECLRRQTFDCAFLDYLLPDGTGLDLVKAARAEGFATPIIMLTGHGDVRLAVELLQAGASDYLPKDHLSGETLSRSLRQVLQVRRAETERCLAEDELKRSNQRTVDILKSISDAFLALDRGWRFTYLNPQAEALLHRSGAELLEKSIWEEFREIPSWFRDVLTCGMTNRAPVSAEGFYPPLEIWLEVHIYPGQEGISAYIRDITERKEMEARLSYLANYDALTGLPNRVLLQDRLRQALIRIPRYSRNLGVLFCDLDRFKIVNDTLGHSAGDFLLQQVADRMLKCVRSGDTVARLGGDEFVILLTDVEREEDLSGIARKILEAVSTPMCLQGHEVYTTASIGITIAPGDGMEPDALLKNADIAMYRAKEKGKNTFEMFSPAMNERSAERFLIESALWRALDRGEMRLHYQPKVHLGTGAITGVEALVRWQHPERGMIPPGDFLPLAAETGLIEALDSWVLQTACETISSLRLPPGHPFRVAVNLSDRQFRRQDLLSLVRDTLKRTGLDPSHLELEITEEVLVTDSERTGSVLQELRQMGVYLSIDDFGTGYSSLAQLKQLPIQALKIDRSFIQGIPEDHQDIAITESIIVMAHRLGLKVIGEGVETAEQQSFLKQRGCDEIQGYRVSRPLPWDDLLEMLKPAIHSPGVEDGEIALKYGRP